MKRPIHAALPATLFIIVLVFGSAGSLNRHESAVSGIFDEDEFYKELNECTTGLASMYATDDGRPLLWKNRDLGGGGDQEYHYINDGRIPFISQAYSWDRSQHYGGINAVGFAVENSNSYNLTNDINAGMDDDGRIMHFALATCRTVDDFQKLLDSTNITKRTLNSNYGVIDAYGGAAIFETGATSYARWDAAAQAGGFLVRSNHSLSGVGLDDRQFDWGPNRYDRAYELFKRGVASGGISVKYIFQKVTRDVKAAGMENYALPYEGYIGNYDYGYVPNADVICRSTTRAVMVAQGVRPGENPMDAILWAMAGNQQTSIVTPLWVRAGSTPVEYDGEFSSHLCDRSKVLRDWTEPGDAINTFHLRNAEKTGFWDWSFPVEDWVFAKTKQFLNSPDFSYDKLVLFQNSMAHAIADSLDAWRPTVSVNEIVEPTFLQDHIVIAWGSIAPDRIIPQGEKPRQYKVYHSDEPFRDGAHGTLVATVTDPRWVASAPSGKSGFYRIEAVY